MNQENLSETILKSIKKKVDEGKTLSDLESEWSAYAVALYKEGLDEKKILQETRQGASEGVRFKVGI